MSEPLFFKASALTVGEIATLTGAAPRADADLGRASPMLAPLDRAAPCDLAFLDSEICQPACDHAGRRLPGGGSGSSRNVPGHVAALCAREALPRVRRGGARPVSHRRCVPSSLFGAVGTAPGATVHASARIETGVSIDPGAGVWAREEVRRRRRCAAGGRPFSRPGMPAVCSR